MVERRNCNFCGNVIEPGTGRMYVRTDGTVYFFDRHKCFQNFVELKRVPREVKWTLLNPSASKWKERPRKKRAARKYMPERVARKEEKEEAQAEQEGAGKEEEQVEKAESDE